MARGMKIAKTTALVFVCASLAGMIIYIRESNPATHEQQPISRSSPTLKTDDQLGLEAEKKQEQMLKNSTTSTEAEAKSKEADRIEFQRRLPTLERPMPNLRWYPSRKNAEQRFSSLVTPYGVCITMTGNENGYSLVTMTSRPVSFKAYPDKSTAVNAAEAACHEWYLKRKQRPYDRAADGAMWFMPEPEP
jgi:hypothetical protein